MIAVLARRQPARRAPGGRLFAAPTYAFIIAIFVLVAVGLIDAAGRGFHAGAAAAR